MSAPKAGALRSRITFQRQVAQPGGGGARAGATWTDVLTCWATIKAATTSAGSPAGLALAQSGAYAEMPCTVTIGWRPSSEVAITNQLRITTDDGRVLTIDSVIDPEERHERLVLLCHQQQTSGNF